MSELTEILLFCNDEHMNVLFDIEPRSCTYNVDNFVAYLRANDEDQYRYGCKYEYLC